MDWLTFSARVVARSIPRERAEQATRPLAMRRRSSKEKKEETGKKPKPIKSRVNREMMTSVIWTTPLGLPVVQPYRKPVKRQILTALQSVYISDQTTPTEVSPQKQATAFPPNFIHSLDATHMLLTALQCKNNNIAFASVHDSYWTHACTIEPMSELIRSTFIELHSADLIGELRSEFMDRNGEHLVPIANAEQMRASARKRKEKEAKRQQEIARITGNTLSKPRPDPMSEVQLKDSGPMGYDQMTDEAVELRALTDTEPSDLLDLHDLAAITKKRGSSTFPTVVINGQAFVKVKDILPPCPKRGVFDVSRVQQSAYFFS